jgi:hypothetical protein
MPELLKLGEIINDSKRRYQSKNSVISSRIGRYWLLTMEPASKGIIPNDASVAR